MRSPLAPLVPLAAVAVLLVLASLGCLSSPEASCATSDDCGGGACVVAVDGGRRCEPLALAPVPSTAHPSRGTALGAPTFNPVVARGRSFALRGSLSVTPRRSR